MISTTIRGGLGNQMFIYAAARAMALRNNTKCVFNLNDGFANDYQFHRSLELQNLNVQLETAPIATFDYKLARYTKYISRKFGRNIIAPHYTYIVEDEPMHFQPELINNKFKNVYLEGYWQCEKYFKDFAEEIKKDFEIVTPLSIEIQNELFRWKSDGRSLVFIGIRRYQECKLIKPEMVLEEDYYNKAIKLIESKLQNIMFVVFTQEQEWAKHNLKSKSPMVFATPKNGIVSSIEDLYLMTNCEHAIISNSSFYWWGAWLQKTHDSEHLVIAPHNFINIDSCCESWLKI